MSSRSTTGRTCWIESAWAETLTNGAAAPLCLSATKNVYVRGYLHVVSLYLRNGRRRYARYRSGRYKGGLSAARLRGTRGLTVIA